MPPIGPRYLPCSVIAAWRCLTRISGFTCATAVTSHAAPTDATTVAATSLRFIVLSPRKVTRPNKHHSCTGYSGYQRSPAAYSETARISRSFMCAATPRMMPFVSLARVASRNAFSWDPRYSAYCPASRGYCAGMPEPAGPWQPEHAGMFLAGLPPRQIFCPRATRSLSAAAEGLSCCASAGPAQQAAKPAPSARRRIIAKGPDRKGQILLEFPGSHENVLPSGVPRGRGPRRGPAAAGTAGSGVCRPLECRQVERDQCAPRQEAPRLYQQDARSHANHQLLPARRSSPAGRSPRLWLRARAAAPARAVGKSRWRLSARAQCPRRRRGGDGCAPPADAARSATDRVARGCPAACAAFQGRQAVARGAGSNPVEGRFSDTGRSTALFERYATGCRRMSRPACRMAASRPRK